MLTTAQQATLAADIANDPVLNALPHNSDGAFEIARQYNALADPAFYVWRRDAPVDDIFDAITWANLTPVDVPSVADSAQVAAAQTTRALICQAKQINLQMLLQGRTTINATKLKVRQALTDSLQNVPAGTSGANLDAGWLAVKNVLYRPATRLEKLLATGNGTTGQPATMGFEGSISYPEVEQARG